MMADMKAQARREAEAAARGETLRPVGVFSPESAKEAMREQVAATRATMEKEAAAPASVKPNLAPSQEARTATAAAKVAPSAPAAPAVAEAKVAAPTPAPTQASTSKGDGDKTEALAKTAKVEKPRATVKTEPAPERAVAKSAFGQALQAEAKEHVRANSVVAAAIAQGLAPDAIKALAEHRLQGSAKELAMAMTSGGADAATIGMRLAESQKITSALQSAAAKAATPEQAQAIVASKLGTDLAAAANSTIAMVANPASATLAAAKESTQPAPQAAAVVPEKVSAPAPEVTVAQASAAAAPEAQAPAPEASGVTAYAVASKDGIEVRPLDQPAPVAAADKAPTSEAVAEAPKAPVVEMSTVAAAEQKAPIVELSTQAAAVAAAPIIEKSTVAVAEQKAPVVEMSTLAASPEKAPIVEKSTLAAAETKAPAVEAVAVAAAPAQAPIVEKSTIAAVEPKAPVVEMSTMAKAQPADAPSIANAMEKALQEAFSNVASKIKDAPANVASLVQDTASKAGAAMDGAATKVNEVIQAAAAAGARPTLEEALASHMKDKGFDMQSIAAAGSIAAAIRDSRGTPGDSVLVLHKGGTDGDPLASVVAAKDVPSIAVKGDSVLALDTLEKVASNGIDRKAVEELRSSLPEAVKGQSDLELAQIHGEAKSALKDLDRLAPGSEQQRQQEQSTKEAPEKVAQAEMAGGGGMSM
jgi:hypothetical protein